MMMACGSIRMNVHPRVSGFHFHVPLSSASLLPIHHNSDSFSKPRNLIGLAATPSLLPKASARNDGPTDDGITLGTVKLPLDTDLQRFDSLLFQWANSLCQGANLPLPVPLKTISLQIYFSVKHAFNFSIEGIDFILVIPKAAFILGGS